MNRLEKAVADNGLGIVAQASASRGAAARGIKISGNTVVMVFRNDYAVRLLAANVSAGIEAPLRIYVTIRSTGACFGVIAVVKRQLVWGVPGLLCGAIGFIYLWGWLVS
ncbi:MAG TPA: hypothetical protein VK138_05880 [Acidiferrobacterales bacterium]|nr:hypothetical protein [Acidiferrobacterales bacterium]